MIVYIILGLFIFLPDFNYAVKHKRIIGGVRTSIENFPYQVSLMALGEHYCGGSIIDREWVLTAAHCLEDIYPSELTIRVGSSDCTQSGKVHRIERFHVHPDYDEETIDFDYALLRVKKPIEYSKDVQPVDLAEPNDRLREGDMLVISGWGTTETDHMSTRLMAVAVPYIEMSVCEKLYDGEITDRMFCAGYPEIGGRDACQGDSGGPIVAYGKQYGIVSWGNGCGIAGNPGVYSKVASQRGWIARVSGV